MTDPFLSQLRLGRPNQAFEVRDLKGWMRELCEALQFAHQQAKLVHGDIKPGNLIGLGDRVLPSKKAQTLWHATSQYERSRTCPLSPAFEHANPP
jgi:hypothetical protein